MSSDTELLKAILKMTARMAFTEQELKEIVSPGNAIRYWEAYNLCDGTRTQGQVASEMGIATSNFSNAVSRWESAGVLFRLQDENGIKLLHAYPILDLETSKDG